MAKYITVDGPTFLSIPDLNLLDGNTANMQQGLGLWINNTNIINLQLVADSSGGFGDYAMRGEYAGGLGKLEIAAAVNVRPSTQHTFGMLVKPSRSGLGRIDFSGNSSGFSAPCAGNPTPLSANVWSLLQCSWTSSAGDSTVVLQPYCNLGSTFIAGDLVFYNNAILAEGSDATFYPSLRINGTLFEDKDPAAMPIGFAGDGTPLTVGAGWAGNAYHYRRYDGADNTAPLVAAFEAEDVPYVA